MRTWNASAVGIATWYVVACSAVGRPTATNDAAQKPAASETGAAGAATHGGERSTPREAGTSAAGQGAGGAPSSAAGSSGKPEPASGGTAASGSGGGGTRSESSAGTSARGSAGMAGTPDTKAAMAGASGMTATQCAMTLPNSTDCGAKLAPGDERTCMLGDRKYLVHAGKTMDLCKPVALVIDAHGASQTAEQELGTTAFCLTADLCWSGLGSGWAAEADAPGGGFIAVFPQGTNNMWSMNDTDFMLRLVTEIKKLANVDPEKIFMAGFSNGGFLTMQTGCAHADVFRGMVSLAGGSSCASVNKPISLISFDAQGNFSHDGHVTANMSLVTANHCKGEAKPWLTIDAKTELPICKSAPHDHKATLVPCNTVTGSVIKPGSCKIWDQCDAGMKVAWCDLAPNTEHGSATAATDAHMVYENESLVNPPSLAWRFFNMSSQ